MVGEGSCLWRVRELLVAGGGLLVVGEVLCQVRGLLMVGEVCCLWELLEAGEGCC